MRFLAKASGPRCVLFMRESFCSASAFLGSTLLTIHSSQVPTTERCQTSAMFLPGTPPSEAGPSSSDFAPGRHGAYVRTNSCTSFGFAADGACSLDFRFCVAIEGPFQRRSTVLFLERIGKRGADRVGVLLLCLRQ